MPRKDGTGPAPVPGEERGWAVGEEVRAADGWGEIAPAQVRQVPAFAPAVGRRWPTNREHRAIR
jgi:hypothetical protein